MNPMPMVPAKIVSVESIAKDTYIIKVLPTNNLSADPFNFFMVWIPRVDEIPLSVSFIEGEMLTFLVKIRGAGTKALASLKPGDFVGLKGPLGKSFIVIDNTKSILVLVGGIGIAPIPLFIQRSRYRKLDLVWGVKSEEELFDLRKLFPFIGARCSVTIATEDCSHGICGTVIDALKYVNADRYDMVLAVGPKAMLRSICKHLGDDKVYVALETMVKCGLGLCGSCYIRSSTKLLCVDGPVFRCSEVEAYIRSDPDS
uniref:FAD-binding FR-type domain-containing protein n=1 Tax=Ignisphaera aggregans TaxID=334771 RepID=A0A7C2VGY7_9CREN